MAGLAMSKILHVHQLHAKICIRDKSVFAIKHGIQGHDVRWKYESNLQLGKWPLTVALENGCLETCQTMKLRKLLKF